MKKRLSVLLLAVALVPSFALAQSTPQTFAALANQIVKILSSATVDLIVLAIVVYFWGVSVSLFKQSEGGERLREQLLWGVIVIFFAVSIWGIVQLLQSSIFGSGATGASVGGGSTSQTCTSLTGCNLQ